MSHNKKHNLPPMHPTHEAIAARAYQIYQSGKGGSPADHWAQAEKELHSHATGLSQDSTLSASPQNILRKAGLAARKAA